MSKEIRSGLMRNIQARLDALGMAPEAASKKAGLHRDFIRNIKRGKSRSPGIEQVKQLARVLECSAEYLLDETRAPAEFPLRADDDQRRELMGIFEQVPPQRRGDFVEIVRTTARLGFGAEARPERSTTKRGRR